MSAHARRQARRTDFSDLVEQVTRLGNEWLCHALCRYGQQTVDWTAYFDTHQHIGTVHFGCADVENRNTFAAIPGQRFGRTRRHPSARPPGTTGHRPVIDGLQAQGDLIVIPADLIGTVHANPQVNWRPVPPEDVELVRTGPDRRLTQRARSKPLDLAR